MSKPTKQTPSEPYAGDVQNETPQSTSPAPPPQFKLIQTTTSLSAIPISNTTSTTSGGTLTLLVHATNTFGTWGAGFAKALQSRCPSAEQVYKSWCDEKRSAPDQWPSRELVGRCLVVPPQQGDAGTTGDLWIACLFTSYGYGGRAVRGGRGGGHAAKDGVGRVIGSTRGALAELREWVRRVEEGRNIGEDGEDAIGDGESQKRTPKKVIVYSPKFNSGNFGVDWEVTAGMIREVFRDWDGEWRILADK